MPVIEQPLWDYPHERGIGWQQVLPIESVGGHDQRSVLTHVGGENEVRIRVKDLQQRAGVSIALEDDDVGPEDTLIRGYFCNRDFRHGLKLSCSNTREEHAFRSRSTHEAGLSCIFFLQGRVGVRIGDRRFDFNGAGARGMMSGAGVLKACAQPFERITEAAQNVSHLVVTASPDWLSNSGFEQRVSQSSNLSRGQSKVAAQQWNPGQRLTDLINQVFSPSVLVPELLDLYLEARSIDIVSETLATLMQGDAALASSERLDRHSQMRLQRARDFIMENPDLALSVDLIARQAGVSASGLQRLFQKSESCSVFDYVRQVRLDKAHELLLAGHSSVQEISAMAGYKNPANFATAFKRRFGLTPRQAAMSV